MKILILVFWLLLASGVRGQEPASPEIYDILLKNGRVLDPAGKHDGRFDIAIARNKIVRIAPDLPSRSARNTIDLSGCLVTAGFIDINAHVDARGAWRSVNRGSSCAAQWRDDGGRQRFHRLEDVRVVQENRH